MFVYLIRVSDNQYYKIGVSKNVKKRIKELQTANAEKILLIDYYKSDIAFKIEKALHNFFHDKKINNEWFELFIEDEVKFKEFCIKIENNLKYLENNKI